MLREHKGLGGARSYEKLTDSCHLDAAKDDIEKEEENKSRNDDMMRFSQKSEGKENTVVHHGTHLRAQTSYPTLHCRCCKKNSAVAIVHSSSHSRPLTALSLSYYLFFSFVLSLLLPLANDSPVQTLTLSPIGSVLSQTLPGRAYLESWLNLPPRRKLRSRHCQKAQMAFYGTNGGVALCM